MTMGFDRLARSLAEISQSRIRVIDGEPPSELRGAAFLTGALAMVCGYNAEILNRPVGSRR